MRKWHLVVKLAFLLAGGMAAHPQQTLRVAAAADLEPVLPAILDQFSAQTGIHTEVSYKSSATLATSIINGAPFDLFLAADLSFPQKVISAGLAEESAPLPYARGTLVLWTNNDSPFHQLSIDALGSPKLKSIAIANPEHAPYGRAAEAALKQMGLYEKLKPKLVIGENIAQAAQYAASGNAELGLISLTSAVTPAMRKAGRYVLIPPGDYPPIVQGAVVVKNSPDSQAAHRLLDFLFSAGTARQLEASGLAPLR